MALALQQQQPTKNGNNGTNGTNNKNGKRPKLPYSFVQLANQTEPQHAAFIARQRAPPAWMQTGNVSGLQTQTAAFVYDSRYKIVNRDAMKYALSVFDHDKDMQTAWAIKLDAAFGGSLRIEYPNRDKNAPGTMGDKQRLKFIKSMFIDLSKRCNRFLWGVGFGAFTYVPDKDGFRVGRILELTEVQVRHYRNALGEDSYMYFEQPAHMWSGGLGLGVKMAIPSLGGNAEGSMLGMGLPIPNVCTWTDMPPDGDMPCSRVLNLIQSKQFLESLQGNVLFASHRNANPPMITERFSKTFNTDDVKNNGFGQLAGGVGGGAGGAAGAGQPAAVARPNLNDMWVQQFLSASDRLATALGTAEFDQLRNKLLQMLVARTSGTAGPRIDLEDDRKYQKPVLAQSPSDVVDYMRLYQESVLMTFGIPPVMVQAESSRGRTSGQDVNALSVFKNHAKMFKHLCIQQFEDMHRILFDRQLFAEYLQNLPPDSLLDNSQLIAGARKYAEVAFDLPGTPPEDVFKELYMMGIYKKESYIAFLSSNYGIPIDDLNKEPEISRELLLGKAGQMGAAGKGATSKAGAKSATAKTAGAGKRKKPAGEKNAAAEANKKAKKTVESVTGKAAK